MHLYGYSERTYRALLRTSIGLYMFESFTCLVQSVREVAKPLLFSVATYLSEKNGLMLFDRSIDSECTSTARADRAYYAQ